MSHPYTNEEAETITERLLDTKAHYKALEQYLRGDITRGEFMATLDVNALVIHEHLLETSADCMRDEEGETAL